MGLSVNILNNKPFLLEQENEDVKKLFAEIPDEDRKQIHKLSYKLAQTGEDKSKLNT